MKIIEKNLLNVIEKIRNKQKNFIVMWTANSTVTRKGNIVCSRGFAKEITERWPGLKKKAAHILSIGKDIDTRKDKYGNMVHIKDTRPRIIHINTGKMQRVGIFPVKEGYWEKAQLDIIDKNAKVIAESAKMNKDARILLNYPGIGAGGLKIEDVHEILKKHWKDLDNIEVYIKPKGVRK